MIQESLTHLPHLPEVNKPGICYVWAIDTINADGVPRLIDLMASSDLGAYPIPVTEDLIDSESSWMKVNDLFPFSFEMVETEEITPNGKLFRYQLSYLLNHDEWESRGAVIQSFENREWVLLIKLMNGTYRIMGSKSRGCDFQAGLSTGKASNGKSAYTCDFSWKSIHRLFYAVEPA